MDQKIVYRANDTLFYNSHCLFVEYMDLIKTPWFVLLNLCRQNEKLKSILDITPIEDFSLDALFEWYMNRKNRNIFYELLFNKDVDLEEMDLLVKSQLEISPIFFTLDTALTVVPAINKILRENIIKEVIVYSEYYNQFMEEDIKQVFFENKKVKYRHGNLKDVLRSIPIDTTYFLSDIEKIIALEETNHLDMASIILPYEYRYNKNEKGEWNIDLEYLAKNHIYKLSFYNACLE